MSDRALETDVGQPPIPAPVPPVTRAQTQSPNRPQDHRTGERRSRERRSAPRPAVDESWFGVAAESPDSPGHGAAWAEDAQSRLEGVVDDESAATSDGRASSRHPSRIAGAGHTAFERIYLSFIAARAALGALLLLALVASALLGVKPRLSTLLLALLYAALSAGMWVLPRFRRLAIPRPLSPLRGPQWLATIGTDIVCFVALHVLTPVSDLNYVPLLVLPVLMAGVLTPRLIALATSAGITLALLGLAWLAVLKGGDAMLLMTQAGLAGSGFFVITVLASELAGRLARGEMTARDSLELARQQARLNRLVIEEMQDGVLVVDRRGRVRAANPAARALLVPRGLSHQAPFPLSDFAAWDALVKTVERAFTESLWPETGRDVVLDFEPGLSRTLRVRVRFTRRPELGASEEFCVLFLEDVRSVQARTRQEKLAAMGRVSAGIAHELRNPLAAIAQANALMQEDAANPEQRQLTKMVADNVERLKRIVDDVMEVAPGSVQEARVINASAHIAAGCSEWARAGDLALNSQAARSVLQIDVPAEPVGVVFDEEHLRRVLINLLDNALRHCSGQDGAVRLRLHGKNEREATLSVVSDGEPITPDVERHLFEPFFSTRSRGTGLGLYICRELCERYGARIEYRLRPGSEALRNEFSVTMRRQAIDVAQSRQEHVDI